MPACIPSPTFNFLVRNEGSESIQGMAVTQDYFKVTGLQPVLGRTFVDSEIGRGPIRAIVIGYGLWQRPVQGRAGKSPTTRGNGPCSVRAA